MGPAACGLSSQLYNSSVIQNEVLFASDGLTLLALDRLYSLKGALSSYSKTLSPLRLEDAVDELRRLVLSRNGLPVPKSDLLRSYDWLNVTNSAIFELDQMYRRAYGGPGQAEGISGMPSFRDRMLQRQQPVIKLDADDFEEQSDDEDNDDTEEIDMAIHLMQPPKSVSPRPPILKLQTSFPTPPPLLARRGNGADDPDEDDEDGDRTARPADVSPVIKLNVWNVHSIDQLLTADVLSPERNSMKMGPMTPHDYDDISPITRGEWGFLMVDNSEGGKKAPIETW